METKHTPTPWELNQLIESSRFEIRGPEDADEMQEIIGSTREKANAEYIVLACNAHDDLVTACRRLIAAMRGEFQARRLTSVYTTEWSDAQVFAEAALAKATGQKGT